MTSSLQRGPGDSQPTVIVTAPGSLGDVNPMLAIARELQRDGERIHLPRRKVESLLAYLLLHREPQSRDHLATLLWGDTSDVQARQSLRTALATVRKEISPDLLHADRLHAGRAQGFELLRQHSADSLLVAHAVEFMPCRRDGRGRRQFARNA